jgi:hypothetical protein
VWHVLRDLSTDTLMRVVAGLELRIIEGIANDDDIDTYAQAQWEIGERTFARGAPRTGDAASGLDEART